ncbi:MAG TPA: NUDIX hydrolase [Bryobacteraceae bacterium]|nr:NUDIX hydrolase [Bryobacteraceae bacterium]
MKIVSSKQVYRCSLFRVTEDRAVDRTGFEIHRSVVRHSGSAVMMAVDDRDRVMLVRQYRLPAERRMWELPAGRIDDGETSLAAARRELKEETGLRARRWKRLVHFYPSPGFLEESMTIWLAKDLEQGDAEPMEDERIETRWFTKKELRAMIASNRIIDGKTMIGFLHWARL